MKISGQIVDIPAKRIFRGEVTISSGRITEIRETRNAAPGFILPGFIDAHVHIESSMLTPVEFARLAVRHGTIATVSDPHEIGNVLGMEGVRFMIENGRKSPFKFFFGAPSCVPATNFETSGASLGPEEIRTLLSDPEGEVPGRNDEFPGGDQRRPGGHGKDPDRSRIGETGGWACARSDRGSAAQVPGCRNHHGPRMLHLRGSPRKTQPRYEILIREGSAAKNFEALVDLVATHPEEMMFCSDDKHPDDLLEGHINQLAARAIAKGIDLFAVLQAACLNPAIHYRLETGRLRKGDPADFIVVDNLEDFSVSQTWLDGVMMAESGESFLPPVPTPVLNNFSASPKSPEDFRLAGTPPKIRVIEALDGELITRDQILTSSIQKWRDHSRSWQGYP